MSGEQTRPRVPFNQPHVTGREAGYMTEAMASRHLSGHGAFTRRTHIWFENTHGCARALLVTSGTAALEMAALLLDLQPGDEVIVPSFTFVTTASAFARAGAVPVYVDIRPDTLNLDENLVEAAITPKTRAIVPVHYAGVACNMDALSDIASRHNLALIEDAAHGIGAFYKNRPLGSLGDAGCFSFHDSKNIVAGEGGALLVNKREWALPAEILWEKGTNRSQFFRGEVDKYTWLEVGSSFVMSELNAAYLWGQLEDLEHITARRLQVWDAYQQGLAPLEEAGLLRRPVIPADAQHNAHLYYFLANTPEEREALLGHLRGHGIQAHFHYVPLHQSPAGARVGRPGTSLEITESVAERLIRLPLWIGLPEEDIAYVVDTVVGYCHQYRPTGNKIWTGWQMVHTPADDVRQSTP